MSDRSTTDNTTNGIYLEFTRSQASDSAETQEEDENVCVLGVASQVPSSRFAHLNLARG
jgi:hypothetical protein